jgi:hypothetical protein
MSELKQGVGGLILCPYCEEVEDLKEEPELDMVRMLHEGGDMVIVLKCSECKREFKEYWEVVEWCEAYPMHDKK